MLMVIPNEGKTLALDSTMKSAANASETWDFKLYKNNYTPVAGSTASDFTESTFGGYALVPVTPSDWGASAIVADVAYATSAVVPSFTCTSGGPEDAYGWFAVGATSGKVRAAQKFDTPRSMSPGATESIDPCVIGLKTLT